MKLLLLHASHLEFEPHKKAVDSAEEHQGKKRTEECLVAFNALEEGDEKDLEYVVERADEEIRDVADQVNTDRVVIYPWVHLTAEPGDMEEAKKSQKMLEEKLKEDFEVTRAPFGWYKEFEIHVKGHPLSELSREIRPEGEGEVEEEVNPEELLGQISRSKLDTKDLEENDHRVIGRKMDLFSFYNAAPGMVFWHENGLKVLNKLKEFWRDMHEEAGYKEISTPMVLDEKLWKISGHWEKYRDNMFPTEYEGRDMAIKPMNCPGGILVYKSQSRSYRELPLRFGELGTVYREELSGVLSGLFRVNCFTQDDAHIYCKEDQLKSELEGVMELTDRIYGTFDLDYSVELSTRPDERIGGDEIWDRSERILKEVLEEKDTDYELNEGDGAFYGPKIDFHIEDSLGRKWQCGTIQLDFSMPERFDLAYVGEDNKKHRPIMIHRAILGSLERFLGILLEHTNGKLPVWMSPVQVRVLSITDRNVEAAKEALEKLNEEGFRVDGDFDSTTLSEKVRNAEIERIPYLVVIGDDEEEEGTLDVRRRWEEGVEYGVDPEEFVEEVQERVQQRS